MCGICLLWYRLHLYLGLHWKVNIAAFMPIQLLDSHRIEKYYLPCLYVAMDKSVS